LYRLPRRPAAYKAIPSRQQANLGFRTAGVPVRAPPTGRRSALWLVYWGMANAARNPVALPPQIILPVGIAIASFLIDLKTPDDIADGFLYLLAVLSCIWVPFTTSALYTAFGLMLPMLVGAFVSPSIAPPWTAITNRALGAIVMWLTAIIVWRNARLIGDREHTLAELERLHGATERAANAERIELSRWLHDGLAQQLVAVGWSLDRIVRHAGDAKEVQAEARELRAMINGALKTVHRKAVELRKLDNELDGLPVLVERHVADFIGRTGLSVELSGTKKLERVPVTYTIVCLKVLQEALTNVAKHASASRILVQIGEESGAVHITITDDGRGMDMVATRNPERLGLLGLHERLTAIGGSLTVSNAVPRGVRIEARVPVE
jgi:signal transduction histidine kinase